MAYHIAEKQPLHIVGIRIPMVENMEENLNRILGISVYESPKEIYYHIGVAAKACMSSKSLRLLGLYLRIMDALRMMCKVYSDGFTWNGFRSLDINMQNCQTLKCIRSVTASQYTDIPKYGLQSKRKCRMSFPLHLDNFQLEHGKQSEKILRNFLPEVCEEIRGVSDTIAADYLHFASWMLCMGCCMYNLENNFPVEIRGCTAFAYSKKGKLIYGRNNDLPPYLRDGCKSEIYAPKNGNRFNITTSSFINGETASKDSEGSPCCITVVQLYILSHLNFYK